MRDVPGAAAFDERYLGFHRQAGPPHAAVFATTPASFAVRSSLPGVDLEAGPVGRGVGILMHAPEAERIHDAMVADAVEIASAPVDGPFGWTFTFTDLDGYLITLHTRV